MKLFNFKDYTTALSQDETIPVWKRILDNKLYRIGIGIISGALLGLLYWNYVGCTGGTCPLTSNPYKTVILFSLMGGLFAKDKKETKNENN